MPLFCNPQNLFSKTRTTMTDRSSGQSTPQSSAQPAANANGDGNTMVAAAKEQRTRPAIKHFYHNPIPTSIREDPALNAAIACLPVNHDFEVHKSIWRIRTAGAKRVALQLPEGLLMCSLMLSDIFTTFAGVTECFVLGDVTYGACCVDDFSAVALGADFLIHYGHSCLVPIDHTKIKCHYVFSEIRINVDLLVDSLKLNFGETCPGIVLAGTIQFNSAIRQAKSRLEELGFRVRIPQSKPLSPGEVLGCTAPKLGTLDADDGEWILVFVADGRFHMEAMMIANPGLMAFRYDPNLGRLLLEEYDHVGMKEVRKKAIEKARSEAKTWGIVLGTLGRQGNPMILERLEKKMREKGFDYVVVLMSELSPARIELFEDSVDAWIQIACPRLSIDWGEAFIKPLLTPFEAEIALGDLDGWWVGEKTSMVTYECGNGCCEKRTGSCCECSNGVAKDGVREDFGGDYPMDYYAKDGGDWNSSYVKKEPRSRQRAVVSSTVNGATS